MNETDKLVNAWLKEKFLAGDTWPRYSPVDHGEPDEIEVIKTDMGWDCGCYSDYTRDDMFELVGSLRTPEGVSVSVSYGRWGSLPRFIEELDAFKSNEVCPYEQEDYDD
ncbi:MAG TPA: hypothetical protein VIY48_19225 [Candidatus Paceibacterota bacterium]